MDIAKATFKDLDQIMDIYAYAREYMASTGNPKQWGDGYPKRELIEEDIKKQQCYVLMDSGTVQGVFIFIIGEDPTYKVIEEGQWKNNDTYGTIHRLAGSGKVKGLARECISFCYGIISNLRADTHADNKIMQHLLEKNGFEKCGRIYVRDGSPRIAYQLCRR